MDETTTTPIEPTDEDPDTETISSGVDNSRVIEPETAVDDDKDGNDDDA